MLEVFRAVMLHAGISAAANALGIAQPTVSRLVADLERTTRLSLFVKRGRTVVPTAQAVELYEQVGRSFIGLEEIGRFAKQMHAQRTGRLAVGSLPALGHSTLPQAIAALRKSLPQTAVRLHIDSSHVIAQMVASMQLDVGFVVAAALPSGVERIGKLSGECRCILPPGHALARRSVVAAAQLAGQPFVTLSGSSRIRQAIESAATAAGVTPILVVETQQSISASALVLEGVGLSVVDPYTATEHVRRGGSSIRFRPVIDYAVDIIAHAESRLGESARQLISEVRTMNLPSRTRRHS